MTPAEIIARAVRYARDDLTPEQMAELVTLSLTGCGIRLIGPDDAKLIETALTHGDYIFDKPVAKAFGFALLRASKSTKR